MPEKPSWDHTPANSDEARDIALRKALIEEEKVPKIMSKGNLLNLLKIKPINIFHLGFLVVRMNLVLLIA